jgi:hypothetical protein
MARKSRPAGTATRPRPTKPEGRATAEQMVGALAQRLEASANVRSGDIVLHLSGAGGGEFCLTCRPGSAVVSPAGRGPGERKPLIEVWGDANVIRSVVDGDKDAVKQFMVGGIRIRGDLRYFSDLALELGILDAPL